MAINIKSQHKNNRLIDANKEAKRRSIISKRRKYPLKKGRLNRRQKEVTNNSNDIHFDPETGRRSSINIHSNEDHEEEEEGEEIYLDHVTNKRYSVNLTTGISKWLDVEDNEEKVE
jgi:hypothetical protein